MSPNPTPTAGVNPPVRLEKPPANGCLHKADGQMFSDILMAGRLAANRISGQYPHMDGGDKIVAAYGSQPGMIVLSHITACMYSYWDCATAGPSAYDVAMATTLPPLQTTLRNEAFHWGTTRVVAPPHESFVLVEDTPSGTIVADETLSKFYRVLGLMKSPARSVLNAGKTLPLRMRITALPFRGVLVYDGLLGGNTGSDALNPADVMTLCLNYKAAQENGKIITGLDVPPPPELVARPSKSALQSMDEAALRAFIRARNGKAEGSRDKLVKEARRVWQDRANEKGISAAAPRGPSSGSTDAELETAAASRLVSELTALKKEKTMVVVRRFGYSAKENPNNLVGIMWGTTMSGTFQTQALMPKPIEVLREFAKVCRQQKKAPEMAAIDDVEIARKLNDVLHAAGVQFGLYPQPSSEEQTLLTVLPPQLLNSLSGFGSIL